MNRPKTKFTERFIKAHLSGKKLRTTQLRIRVLRIGRGEVDLQAELVDKAGGVLATITEEVRLHKDDTLTLLNLDQPFKVHVHL